MDDRRHGKKDSSGHRRGSSSTSSRGHRRRGPLQNTPAYERRRSQTQDTAQSAPFPSSERTGRISEELGPFYGRGPCTLPPIRDVLRGHFPDTPSLPPEEEPTTSHRPSPSPRISTTPEAESSTPQYTMTYSFRSPPAATHQSVAPGRTDSHGAPRDRPILPVPASRRSSTREHTGGSSGSTRRVMWGQHPVVAGYAIIGVVDSGGPAGAQDSLTSGEVITCGRCGQRTAYLPSTTLAYCSSCRGLWSREE
ncbi:hypothetical protein GGR58DRAFT_50596 [Xylaria digitata]|nr:hypothetical protein GGR58DRAFT_50596 [Xylaria digitata]